MDFSITEEQYALLERLDQFCRENLSESAIKQWIIEGGVPDSFMLKYYKNDFGRIGLPTRMGGITEPVITRVLVLERLAMHAGATLPAQSLMTYMHFISNTANEEQVEALRSVTERTGKVSFSFAITEPQSGSKTFDIRTTAIEDEAGFVINGAKAFVNSGQYAPYIVLIARDPGFKGTATDGHEPLTFFLIPRDCRGVDTYPMSKIGQRLIPTADIVFDNVRIGKDAILGQRGSGAEIMLQSFEYGRTYACATSVGLAEAAFNEAVGYALERSISGSPLIEIPQIQSMLTDMQVKIDAMRALLYKTACSLDMQTVDVRLETALLKRFVPKTALEVADDAMQIMGGMGYLRASRTARIWEECRGNRIVQGTDEIMSIIASKRIARRAAADRSNPPTWRF